MQQESKRQLQVAQLIEHTLNTIFQKLGISIIQGGLVSIYKVSVTPDLLEARALLSIYGSDSKDEILKSIKSRMGEIRGALGNELRHQVRRIPILTFELDDTLEYVDKMERLFKEIKEKDNKIKEDNAQNE